MKKQPLPTQATQIMAPLKKEPHYSFGEEGRGLFIAPVVAFGAIAAAWLAGGSVSGVARGGGGLILGGSIILALALAILVVGLVVEWQVYQTYQAEKKVYEEQEHHFAHRDPRVNAEVDFALDNDPDNPLLEKTLEAQEAEIHSIEEKRLSSHGMRKK